MTTSTTAKSPRLMRFTHGLHDGSTVLTHVLQTTLHDWHNRPEHLSTLWLARIHGDEVTAVSVTIIPTTSAVESYADDDPNFHPVF